MLVSPTSDLFLFADHYMKPVGCSKPATFRPPAGTFAAVQPLQIAEMAVGLTVALTVPWLKQASEFPRVITEGPPVAQPLPNDG